MLMNHTNSKPCSIIRIIYVDFISFEINVVLNYPIFPTILTLSIPISEGDTNSKSRVENNYVRWLQSSGADLISVHPWTKNEDIDFLLKKVNGVLLQGNPYKLDVQSNYYKKSKYIYEKVIEMNDLGTKMPIIILGDDIPLICSIISEDNLSINTELKKIQDEFNAGKEERMLKVDKDIRDKFNKYMEDTKETKKTIFDIKPSDEKRIKYKDYLHYNDDIKKERKELNSKLNKLDDKIKQIHSNANKELTKEQITKMSQELDNFHSSEEFKQKYNSLNVPGLSLLNRLQKDMKEFETNNKELELGLIETKKLIEEQEKKNSKEEKEKYIKEIVEPFLEHEKEVDKLEKENKNDTDKVKLLEEEMLKEEELLNNIQNNLNELNNNKNKYEEMFEEADKIILENNPDFNNNNFDENFDFINKYEVEKLVEEQKENERQNQQLQRTINDLSDNIIFVQKQYDAETV